MILRRLDFLSTAALWMGLFAVVGGSDVGGDVKGCGGFVKSNKNIDFSRIQVELYAKTQQGAVLRKLSSTYCAPNNGYYFLLVEENGSYRLKVRPPHGWKIEPAEVDLEVDGEHDLCSKNQDVNFEFSGFGITGSVVSQGSSLGPRGVNIELVDPGASLTAGGGQVLQAARTDEEGQFVFFGVLPGRYVVRVGASDQEVLSFQETQQEVAVGEDVANCRPFKVEGYALTGRVSSAMTTTSSSDSGKGLLPSVGLELLDSKGRTVLGRTDSRSDGSYHFKSVGVGNYLVRAAKYEGLDLDRAEASVSVGHENQVVAGDFVIRSFSVSGKVMSGGRPLKGAKVTVADVDDDHHVKDGSYPVATASDGQGRFSIHGISASPVKLQVTLDGFNFDPVTLSVTDRRRVDPIVPARFLLTGKVERDSIPPSTEIKVNFMAEQEGGGGSSSIGKVLVTEKGTYSIYLPAGRYLASVEVGGDGARLRNVGFAPVKRSIVVEDRPVPDINFQPVKVNLRGSVECLDSGATGHCYRGVEVVLLVDDGNDLVGGDGSTRRVSHTVSDNGLFGFEGVLPGTYRVSVVAKGGGPRGPLSREVCWEDPDQQVTLSSSDVDGLVFRQSGYYLDVSSPHDTTLVVSPEDSNSKDQQVIPVKAGNDRVCLKVRNGGGGGRSGTSKFRLSTRGGCIQYSLTPDNVDLGLKEASGLPLRTELKPIQYEVTGSIVSGSGADIPDLSLTAMSDRRSGAPRATGGANEEVQLSKVSRGRYKFSFKAVPGEEVSFRPRSEEFLFDPEVLHVFVGQSCHLDSVKFAAVSGFFLKGRVEPPVQGAEVMAFDLQEAVMEEEDDGPEEDHHDSSLKPHQGRSPVKVTLTDKSGNFRLGPLPNEGSSPLPGSGPRYQLQVRKDGYIFEESSSGTNADPSTSISTFVSRKLASIEVKVSNVPDDAPSIVISVSGGSGRTYRSNALAKPEGGHAKASFLSLTSPGEYFIRPQLKEYRFEPQHQLISLVEGEATLVTFEAKRVAFSAFGRVESLNGQAEPGVALIAKPVEGRTRLGPPDQAEELDCTSGGVPEEGAVSDNKAGEFRFRGLYPGCEYLVTLGEVPPPPPPPRRSPQPPGSPGRKAGLIMDDFMLGVVNRVYPQSVRVRIAGQQNFNITTPFVAFRAFRTTDITILTYDDDNRDKTTVLLGNELTVKLAVTEVPDSPDDAPVTIFSTKRLLGEIVVLPTLPKDGREYVLDVETVSKERFVPKKSASMRFSANSSEVVLRAYLKRSKPSDGPLASGPPAKRPSLLASLILLPLAALVAGVVFYRDSLLSGGALQRRLSSVKFWGGGAKESEVSITEFDDLMSSGSAAAASGFKKRNKKRFGN